MYVFGLDIGDARTGVAVGTTELRVATPLATLPSREVFSLSGQFLRLFEEYQPELFVCGCPLSLSGDAAAQAAKIETQGRDLALRCHVDFAKCDERLSSVQAKRVLRSAGLSEKQMRGKIDSVAASLILQAWFDACEHTPTGDI